MKQCLVICVSVLTITWPFQSGGAPRDNEKEIPFSGGKTQGQSYILPLSGDYPFINLLKAAPDWSHTIPSQMDGNGYPVSGATLSGFTTTFNGPGQVERPGHQVVTWLGSGRVGAFYQNFGGGQSVAACTGKTSSNFGCDNSDCTAVTGSVAGKLLTVTVASSCNLVIGQPIAGYISQFDVPTYVVGNATTNPELCSPACTGKGRTGTYAINWSQTVALGQINVGGRLELAPGKEINPWVSWELQIGASSSGNTVQHVAFLHKDDESSYWEGEIFGKLFKKRIQQGGFGVWRNLDWSAGNSSNCTWWATRKPTTYYSYAATEARSSLFAGNASYELNDSSNDYSVTFTGPVYGASGVTYNSGAPIDKQTIIITFQNTATNATATFNLNGAGKKKIYWGSGQQLFVPSTYPTSGYTATLVFDKDLDAWMIFGGPVSGGTLYGLQCMVPPEVFLQLNKEVGTHPWFVSEYLSLDPMTDWTQQLATYVKENGSSWMIPRFELVNEIWNCTGSLMGAYASAKSKAHWPSMRNGYYCGSAGGDFTEWAGMVGSKVGQDVNSVYGDKSKYKVVSGVQTGWGGAATFNPMMTANRYTSDGPFQQGYSQSAAYKWITSIAVAPYWSPEKEGTQAEVSAAYRYSISPSESLFTAYIGTPYSSYLSTFKGWHTWASKFGVTQMEAYEGGFNLGDTPLLSDDAGGTITGTTFSGNNTILIVPGNACVAGQTVTLRNLAGGKWPSAAGRYSIQSNDTDSDHCAIDLDSGGLGTVFAASFKGGSCRGVEIKLSGVVGRVGVGMQISAGPGIQRDTLITSQVSGTPGIDGVYTLSQSCFVGSSIAMTGGPSMSYTGSKTYVNAFRLASYNSIAVATQNIEVYKALIDAGGEFPSLYTTSIDIGPVSSHPLNCSWCIWNPDIYGVSHTASDPGTLQWQSISNYNQ